MDLRTLIFFNPRLKKSNEGTRTIFIESKVARPVKWVHELFPEPGSIFSGDDAKKYD